MPIVSIFWLLLGGLILYYGAEWIVRSGSFLAGLLGISPLVVGLTVVAFGTSMPELIVSLKAALDGMNTIAVGNVIGSNIANVGLVLGLSTLIFPIHVAFSEVKRDMVFYLAVCILFIAVAYNGSIGLVEGVILVTGLILYTYISVTKPHEAEEFEEVQYKTKFTAVLVLILGMVALYVGAERFLFGAVGLAEFFGVSEVVIGLTIVAFGTSLPELATSLVAAFRKEHAISLGNIVGSNLFNILSVMGVVSIITPLATPLKDLWLQVTFMILYGVILIPVSKYYQPIPRAISVGLISGYVLFILLLFI